MSGKVLERMGAALRARSVEQLERRLAIPARETDVLDLSSNDYFRLSQHPLVKAAACETIASEGTSSRASPLVTGYGREHESFLELAQAWHGFECGMVWNSGYAANHALLSVLPREGDWVIADRLAHNSALMGALHGEGRLQRFPHNDVKALASMLAEQSGKSGQVFVFTESVYGMDGDYPALHEIASLKSRYDFCWIVDEAHALGWYGERGAGLVEAFGCGDQVDILVGTMGKALGSMGAYTLFHDERFQRYLVNFAPEFIYSTYLPAAAAAAARASIRLLLDLDERRAALRVMSRSFRKRLRDLSFEVPDGDSPVAPLIVGEASEALRMAQGLRERGIWVGAIRPPAVPKGSCRLRLSLNADLSEADLDRVIQALVEVRA